MGADTSERGREAAAFVDAETRTVSAQVYQDPTVYELEQELLFARAWIVVAHESELAAPGDYVMRYIGDDPVIVTRARSGSIYVLLNACSHKGAMVCRSERGNAAVFKCPYHGWAYDSEGSLVAMVAQREIYPEDFDKRPYALPSARVATYAGLVFATFDEHAPPLDEFLGDYRFYLDMLFDRTDAGMEVVGPPQRWVIPANWKTAAEQFSTDGYHALTLHRSLTDLGVFGSPDADFRSQGLYGVDITTPQGHALRLTDIAGLGIFDSSHADFSQDGSYKGIVPPGMTPDMVAQMERKLSTEQLYVLAKYPPTVGQVFPNMAWLSVFNPSMEPEPKPSGIITFRLWNPLGVDRMEVWNWVLVERDAPQEMKDRVHQSTIFTFSASGIFEQDDAEVWPSMQRATRGVMGRRRRMTYPILVGDNRPDDYPKAGVGQPSFGVSQDDNQWQFWVRWAEFMAGKAW